MRLILFGLLIVHGLLHLLGVARAFGLPAPEQLAPVSRPAGVLWGCAGLAMLGTAVAAVGAPLIWGIVGILAVVLSQAAILTSWRDAKAGTLVNVVVLVAAIYGLAAEGPISLRAEHEALIAR